MESDITNIRGFGYSFSNTGKNLKGNDAPYFAVGAVNNDHSTYSSIQSSLVLFKTPPFCINMNPNCKTSISINPISVTRETKGK